jgi:hypothetical protein
MLDQWQDPTPRSSTVSNTSTHADPDLHFLENLDGRGYATSTTFIDIPVKRNSSSVKYQAASRPLFASYRKPDRVEDPDTFVDFKRSLVSFMEEDGENSCMAHSVSETQWYQLNQMRIHAGAPERSEEGIERLFQYYFQLVGMERKFPFDTMKVDIAFGWKDAFQHNTFSSKKGIDVFNVISYDQMYSV